MQEIKEILHEKLLNTSNAVLEGRTNYVLYDIEDTLSMLAQLEQMTPLGLGECLGLVTGAYAMLSDSCEIHDISSPSNRQRPQMVQGTKGAPKFEIPISVLESLLDSDFTVKVIICWWHGHSTCSCCLRRCTRAHQSFCCLSQQLCCLQLVVRHIPKMKLIQLINI